MKNQKGSALAGLIVAVIVIAVAVGWVRNAYKFATADFESPYKAEVIRGVSIFVFPVAVVVGWVTFEEEESK